MIGTLRKHAMAPETCKKCGGAFFGSKDCPNCRGEKKPSRNYEETKVQKKLVLWLKDRPDWMVIRCENAALRTPAQQSRDKAMGMHTGAPDLVLLYRDMVIWFEVKAANGKVRPDQEQCHKELRARGQRVAMGFGYENCILLLEGIEHGYHHG